MLNEYLLLPEHCRLKGPILYLLRGIMEGFLVITPWTWTDLDET